MIKRIPFSQQDEKKIYVEVSRQEFIKFYVEHDGDEEKALFHAIMSEKLGSHVKIGSKMVKSIGESNEAT